MAVPLVGGELQTSMVADYTRKEFRTCLFELEAKGTSVSSDRDCGLPPTTVMSRRKSLLFFESQSTCIGGAR